MKPFALRARKQRAKLRDRVKERDDTFSVPSSIRVDSYVLTPDKRYSSKYIISCEVFGDVAGDCGMLTFSAKDWPPCLKCNGDIESLIKNRDHVASLYNTVVYNRLLRNYEMEVRGDGYSTIRRTTYLGVTEYLYSCEEDRTEIFKSFVDILDVGIWLDGQKKIKDNEMDLIRIYNKHNVEYKR